ncbi:MAG: proprotein convertase P-domain-containing protein [Myxococcales bacterium]|nr:proprotein convertase P-domain-containing protein [Myxococcales bacterium]
MRAPLLAAAAVTAALGARPAAADELTSALDQGVVEISHAVEVSVAAGVARYRVRRTFANPGAVADEARLEIDLPYGAAATGLRIRARRQWFDGDLLEATAALARYQELTGRGRWEPKDPALLAWRWADKLALQVFPVLPGATSTVEYTLTVPTRYRGGRVFLSYPRPHTAGSNLAEPVVVVRPAWADATTPMRLDGERVATDTPLVLRPPADPPWLAAIERDEHASYAASAIEVAATPATRRTFAAATVTLDLEHTFRGDLRIALVTPAGAAIELFGGEGGGANDVRGRFPVTLPAGTTGAGTWRLVVSDHAALDTGTLEGWALELELGDGAAIKVAATDTPVFVPDAPERPSDGGVAVIELAPPAIHTVAARLGRVVASPAHAFTRLELDVAPVLRPLPRRPQVVFAIDASHSMGPAGIELQLALVRAYLGHVPDAEVELVVYRRAASRLFGAFVPARELDARLAAAVAADRLAPGNGSALDDAARVAAAALAGRPGPRRVVLVSDALVRPRWDDAPARAALAALPADTVVHVVVASPRHGGEPALERDDDHALAPLALAHRGILAELAGGRDPGKALPRLTLGLVRPVQLDHVQLRGLDRATGRAIELTHGRHDRPVPSTLPEGAGLRLVVDHAHAPTRVELTAMIWGERFRRVIDADAAFSRAAAAWVFSEDDHGALSPAEMMTVAMQGRAVSPVTSYLAIEPGVRPSTIGLEREGQGRLGSRSVRAPRVVMGTARTRARPDPAPLLAAGVRACVDRHRPAAGWQLTLELDTSYDEIVDVTAPDARTPLASCLVEAAWAARLTPAFDLGRERFTLTLR